MKISQKVIYYVLLVLVSAGFIFSGYSKLSADPMSVAGFVQAHLPLWFMYFIGACELFGGVGLWVSSVARYAALGLLIILAGAVVVTLIFTPPAYVIVPLMFAIALFIVLKLGTKKHAVVSATN